MLSPPPSLADLPLWIFHAHSCLVGWEDDPNDQSDPRRWRMVARRFDDPSIPLVAVLTKTISREAQMTLLGRYLAHEEAVLDAQSSRDDGSDWYFGGLISLPRQHLALGGGKHPLVIRAPCRWDVMGVRMPRWRGRHARGPSVSLN